MNIEIEVPQNYRERPKLIETINTPPRKFINKEF